MDHWNKRGKKGRYPHLVWVEHFFRNAHYLSLEKWPSAEHHPKPRCITEKKCDVHVAYLGMGQFVELVEWDKPLEIATETDKTRSIVIGELSTLPPKQTTKDDSISEPIKSSGDSTPKQPTPGTSNAQDNLPPTVPDDPIPSTSADMGHKDVELKTLKLQVQKLGMGKDQLIYINQKTLEKYPLSKY